MPVTLPRRFFVDPAHFEREVEGFFLNRWICVGRTEEVEAPGDYFARTVAGESFLVTRGSSGELSALFNVCRHRGTRLLTAERGRLDGRIACPYHGWTYDLSGRLLGAPHMGDGFCREDFPLAKGSAAVWDGHVFVKLAQGEGVSLEEQLGDLPSRFSPWRMGDLRLGKRISYEVRANWKLIVLNFSECLHCPILHPALNRLHHYLGADNIPPHPSYIGGAMGFKPGVETMSRDGKRRRECLPGLGEPDRQRVHYYAIYPNLLLSLHPDYMMTHTLWPRACDRTEVVCEWHFEREEMGKAGFESEDAVAFWDETNREDFFIAEQSQAGIASRAYVPGPYSEREALLWAFDAVVRAEAERS